MPFFRGSNGLQMHYEVYPGAVPMDTLLIHGNLASNLWWEPAIAVWNKRATGNSEGKLPGRLIAAEWRGCGKSAASLKSESQLEMAALAHDYVELLEGLGIERTNLVGHSTGGLIGLFAMKERPSLFHRAVLLDPVSPVGAQLSPDLLAAMAEMRCNRPLCSTILSSAMNGIQVGSDLFERIVDSAMAAHPMIWEGVLRVLSKVDFRPNLPAIRQPCLVLHGEKDLVLPLEGSRKLASALPNGRFESLAGQGHSCNIENPDRFVDLSSRFLFG